MTVPPFKRPRDCKYVGCKWTVDHSGDLCDTHQEQHEHADTREINQCLERVRAIVLSMRDRRLNPATRHEMAKQILDKWLAPLLEETMEKS